MSYRYELSPDERIAILTKRIDNMRRAGLGGQGRQTAFLNAQKALQEAVRDKRAFGGDAK